jgi:hypothetical protein
MVGDHSGDRSAFQRSTTWTAALWAASSALSHQVGGAWVLRIGCCFGHGRSIGREAGRAQIRWDTDSGNPGNSRVLKVSHFPTFHNLLIL